MYLEILEYLYTTNLSSQDTYPKNVAQKAWHIHIYHSSSNRIILTYLANKKETYMSTYYINFTNYLHTL